MNHPSVDSKIMEFIQNDEGFQRAWNNGQLAEAWLAIRTIHLSLIDKTEPVSGAVTAEDLRKCFLPPVMFEEIIGAFDVYPKGTVARLMMENEDGDYSLYLEIVKVKKLQAEVARLKQELASAKPQVKQEVAGCGAKLYTGISETIHCGMINKHGERIICYDCQAKASSQAILDSSKPVELPEVPHHLPISEGNMPVEYFKMEFFNKINGLINVCEALRAEVIRLREERK